jgi:hypothetical protein
MQVFIIHNQQRHSDPALEPPDLKAVWFADSTSLLAARAAELSQDGNPALAVLEYEGDSLKLWLFEHGTLTVEYDASPSFATCTITPPVGSDLERMAEAFGVPENTKAVVQLLQRKRGFGFINERDRLRQLLGLLQLEV